MAALEKNNIYTARIEGYSSEGLGIARIDGQVVFVHGAVRGELCRILVMKVLKNAAFGKVTELLEPSPERREPDCPYYGRCGGCDFRHLSYREELWAFFGSSSARSSSPDCSCTACALSSGTILKITRSIFGVPR